MDVDPLKKDVCKSKKKHGRNFKRNKKFKDLIKIDYYGSGENKSIYSDTTMEVC